MFTKMHMLNDEIRKHEISKKRKMRKFVIVGSKGSGKKALINRFFGLPFDNKDNAENDIYKHKKSYKGYQLNIQIAILAEIKNEDSRKHIKTADGIILTYEYESVESAQKLIEIYSQLREIREDKMPLVVVGTKTDLHKGNSPVSSNDFLKSLSNDSVKKMPHAKHIVTSAKHNINVAEVFNFCLSNAIKRIHTLSMSEERPLICRRKNGSSWRNGFLCRNLLLCVRKRIHIT